MNDVLANPAATIGHNEPPDQGDVVSARMKSDYAELAANAEAKIADALTVPDEITNDDELALVNKYVVDLRDVRTRALAAHKKEKQPFLRAGEAVDGFFFSIRDKVDKIGRLIAARGTDYLNRKAAAAREKARLEREAAERAAAEAQAKIDAENRARAEAQAAAERARKPEKIEEHETRADDHAQAASIARVDLLMAADAADTAKVAEAKKAADLARQRHDETGGLSTLKQAPYVEILDASKLDLEILRPFIKEDELLRALKAWAKTTGYKRPMAGAVIEMRATGVYR